MLQVLAQIAQVFECFTVDKVSVRPPFRQVRNRLTRISQCCEQRLLHVRIGEGGRFVLLLQFHRGV